jgi:Mce-associated membrane protein
VASRTKPGPDRGGPPVTAVASKAGPGPDRGGLAVTAVAVLSTVVVALVVSGAVLLILRHNLRHDQDVRQDVLNAARQQALNMTTLDARTLDADYERMLAGTVDPLRADLERNRADARQALATSRGVSSGTVTDAGLVEMQGDRASAVVIVDAVQTNTVTRSSISHRFRFQLDLTRQGGRWLVANLESVDICGSGSSSEPGCATAPAPSTTPTPKPSATKR